MLYSCKLRFLRAITHATRCKFHRTSKLQVCLRLQGIAWQRLYSARATPFTQHALHHLLSTCYTIYSARTEQPLTWHALNHHLLSTRYTIYSARTEQPLTWHALNHHLLSTCYTTYSAHTEPLTQHALKHLLSTY